jgi:thioredoxin-like negative regulator of GroEL
MREHTGSATWILALLLAAASSSLYGQDGPGDVGYARGMELLEKGDFEAALPSFAEAAKADEAPVEYKRTYLQVRTLIKVRQDIVDEQDPEKWWTLATRLRNYYYRFRLYDDLLAIARQMHDERPSSGTASLVADALLTLGRNDEAESILTAMDADSLTGHAKVLLGVAHARQGKMDGAKAVLAAAKAPDPATPRFLFDLARLQVLCGQTDEGLSTLTMAFESTAAGGLPGFRTFVAAAPDFGSVPAARFEQVLATESKIVASSCSGGDTCGSCPRRAECEGGGE